MRTENESITPTLTEVIQTVIDSNLIDMHVCLPAKIVSYDSDTQFASVQPSLFKKYEGSDVPIKWPVIPNIPLIFPRAVAGQSYLHMPITVGDDVTLIVCERSLDNWKSTGLLSDPMDRRKFNITDAFAIPGGSGSALAFSVDDPKSVELANLAAFFQMKPTGQIELSNNAVSLILALTKATIDAAQVEIGTGASHGVGLGDVIENRLSALENALATLTSVFGAAHTHPVISLGSPTGPPIPIATPFVAVPTPAASQTVKVST